MNFISSCGVTLCDLPSYMKSFLILPLLAFLAVSCSSNHTPAKRITLKPEFYEGLSSRHKALVDKGEIENGMRTEAVYLAWGNPAARTEGQDNGQDIEKWTYTKSSPIYYQSLYGGYGYSHSSRYARYGNSRGFSPYGTFGTQVSFVPYRSAWVKFRNGQVYSWQRSKAPQ